jgi:hypothetical protein
MTPPLIKSRYAPSTPPIDGRGFVNHLDLVVKDMGIGPSGAPLIEAYKVELIQNMQSTSGTGGKPRNIAVFRKVLDGDGLWHLIALWQEGIDYDDASAAGSVDVDPTTGRVLVVMSFGKKNAAGAMQYQPWEAMIDRATFAPPVNRPAPPAQAANTLGGVSQGEPGAIEVRGGAYAYVDLSTSGDQDFGLRIIRDASGARIEVNGPLVIRTSKGETTL